MQDRLVSDDFERYSKMGLRLDPNCPFKNFRNEKYILLLFIIQY